MLKTTPTFFFLSDRLLLKKAIVKSNLILVCGHRPKTQELLLLFLFFSACLISYLKKFKRKNFSFSGNPTRVLRHPSQSLHQLSYSNIDQLKWKIIYLNKKFQKLSADLAPVLALVFLVTLVWQRLRAELNACCIDVAMPFSAIRVLELDVI